MSAITVDLSTRYGRVNDSVLHALWDAAHREAVDPYEVIPILVQTFHGLLDTENDQRREVMDRLLSGLTPTTEGK